jgi:hypothetical protein
MRSRLPELVLVALPTYASALDKPVHQQSKRTSRAKSLKLRIHRLEKVLAIGNWLFEALRLIENNWRTEVLERKTPYNPDEAGSILDFYRHWAQPCRRCLDEIEALESEGGLARGAKKFRRYCEQATDILMGDNPFFEDAEKAGRWAAVTAKYREACRPVRVDEDGRIYEMSGERFNMPGLTPADILESFEDERAGRMRPLKEVIASRQNHGI